MAPVFGWAVFWYSASTFCILLGVTTRPLPPAFPATSLSPHIPAQHIAVVGYKIAQFFLCDALACGISLCIFMLKQN